MSDQLDDVFGEPNGPAYEHTESRRGVPLDYVAEKLRNAVSTLHHAIRGLSDPNEAQIDASQKLPLHELRSAFHYALTSYLALKNMLGGLQNLDLPDHLLTLNRHEFRDWLDRVDRGGTVSDADV